MKSLLLIILIASVVSNSAAQEKFSKEVKDISEDVVSQITGGSAKAKLGNDTANFKVAIVSIENEDKKNTKLTELLENKIAINLAMKSQGRYDILDRNYIEQLMKEKNIPLAYDNKKDFAKNLGRIKAANFIIVGTLSNFENDFELNLQIIETIQGNTIGGATGTITATDLLKAKNMQTSVLNAGNVPVTVIASKPVVETSKPTPPPPVTIPTCESQVGTISITSKWRYKYAGYYNNSDDDHKVVVRIPRFENATVDDDFYYIIIGKEETRTFDLKDGYHEYEARRYCNGGYKGWCDNFETVSSGQVKITKCKTTDLVIK